MYGSATATQRALRILPENLLLCGAGFIFGAAGALGFAPLALPAVAGAWLTQELSAACFALTGALMGTLVSRSFASFSACALFAGAQLLLSLRKKPSSRGGALFRAAALMAASQTVLLPFIYPPPSDEFILGAGALLLSPAALVIVALGARALRAYIGAKRLSKTEVATLFALLALMTGALLLSGPLTAAGGLIIMLSSSLAVCRQRAAAAKELSRTRKELLGAAGVARSIARFVEGNAGNGTLVQSQLEGMGDAMERLATRPNALMRPAFSITVGTAGVPMRGSAQTGDSVLIRKSVDKALLIISDGMGTGEAAHSESASAAALLADMLTVGYGDGAHESLNGLLLLTGEEIYATVDAAAVDLTNGGVRMLKFGAPPSYILREGKVRVVESPALPAGILPQARAGEAAFKLRRGDALIMMSDGLLDALGMELIAAIVERVGSANTAPDAAQELVALGVERSYGDDMSVIVARVD